MKCDLCHVQSLEIQTCTPCGKSYCESCFLFEKCCCCGGCGTWRKPSRDTGFCRKCDAFFCASCLWQETGTYVCPGDGSIVPTCRTCALIAPNVLCWGCRQHNVPITSADFPYCRDWPLFCPRCARRTTNRMFRGTRLSRGVRYLILRYLKEPWATSAHSTTW